MSEKLARLTFNDAAGRRHFGGAGGLKVRITDGSILLHPTTDEGQIPFMASPSGRMADIDSADAFASRLMQILQNSGYSAKEPFFVLHDNPKGWLSVEHFPFDKAPPKSTPHFRVWPLCWSPNLDTRNDSFDLRVWRAARGEMLRACETIQSYEQGPKVGRPPRAVQQAKDMLGSLNQLLAEMARITRSRRPAVVHQSLITTSDVDVAAVMNLIDKDKKQQRKRA